MFAIVHNMQWNRLKAGISSDMVFYKFQVMPKNLFFDLLQVAQEQTGTVPLYIISIMLDNRCPY